MEKVTLQRVLKNGFISFFRNGLVSVATVLVMSLSMFMLGSVLVGSIFLGEVITVIEEKVDVSVYFKQDAQEPDILALKADLERHPDVKSVAYVSREEALKTFMDRHQGDELVLQSIEAVAENPFSANLNIGATDPSRYESISQFIERSPQASLIESEPSIRCPVSKQRGILRGTRPHSVGPCFKSQTP